MRVGVYNLYWTTYGGGEQVASAIAEHLLGAGHEVTLFGPEPIDHLMIQSRLGRDLSGSSWCRVINDDEASAMSADVDLFINCTYLSTAVPRSATSLYYAHFPGVPVSTRRRLVSVVSRVGGRVLALAPRLPRALRGVKAGLARRVTDDRWVGGYDIVAANSTFTAEWTRRLWNVGAVVLYPPVTMPSSENANRSDRSIVSLGRFFDRRFGHCKKQDVLLDAWLTAEDSGICPPDWRLRMIGGADGASRDYVLNLRRRSLGTRASIEVNVSRLVVDDALRSASIFWHAGGYGEDPERHPERFEHFGIAVVEAMAAGCVPVVYGVAGPAEIVRHGVDGFHWRSVDELIDYSRRLIDDPSLMASMSAAAVERSRQFSDAAFGNRLIDVLDGIGT